MADREQRAEEHRFAPGPSPSHVPIHAETAAKARGSEPVVRLGTVENRLPGGAKGIRTAGPLENGWRLLTPLCSTR
jgi:hypothetical protein